MEKTGQKVKRDKKQDSFTKGVVPPRANPKLGVCLGQEELDTSQGNFY